MNPYDQVQEAVKFIRKQTNFKPEIGIVLGSGLGPMADEIKAVATIPYGEIPHFPKSTAPGHEGKLVLGTLEGKNVVGYKGRVHYYEGYSSAQVMFPIRVGYYLGVRNFILTSAAGGLNPNWNAGEFMLHLDYLNMSGDNPMIGPNDERFGPRFPVMFDCYDPGHVALARRVARTQDFALREGTYVWISGPTYASRAELRLLRNMGADAIGMSMVPEVMAARHLGAKVLGLSSITDMAIADRDHHADEAEVLRVAAESGARFRKYVRGIVAEMGKKGKGGGRK
jgi:purine-nucleoside phosphorylase